MSRCQCRSVTDDVPSTPACSGSPPAKTYNDLTMGSTVVRCVAIFVYMICYVFARLNPDNDDVADSAQAEVEVKKDSASIVGIEIG